MQTLITIAKESIRLIVTFLMITIFIFILLTGIADYRSINNNMVEVLSQDRPFVHVHETFCMFEEYVGPAIRIQYNDRLFYRINGEVWESEGTRIIKTKGGPWQTN